MPCTHSSPAYRAPPAPTITARRQPRSHQRGQLVSAQSDAFIYGRKFLFRVRHVHIGPAQADAIVQPVALTQSKQISHRAAVAQHCIGVIAFPVVPAELV